MTTGIVVDIDRFAELSAELADPFLPRESTLSKAGLSDAEYDLALRHWRERMAADAGEGGVATRFAEAYSRTRGQLARARRGARAEQESAPAGRFLSTEVQSFREEAAAVQLHAPTEVTSETLDPKGEVPVSLLPSAPISPVTPLMPPSDGQQAAVAGAPVAVPSYLRVEPPRSASPWSGAAPSPVSIPQSPPGAPSPGKRPPINFQDVDSTCDALPSLRDAPLPFSDKPSAAFVAAMSAPAIPNDPSGETVMIPALREKPAHPLPFAAQPPSKPPPAASLAKPPPTLTVQQYASLSAELLVAPEKTAATLARYGVPDIAARGELDRVWAARFKSEPGLHRQWETLFSQYREWLVSSSKR